MKLSALTLNNGFYVIPTRRRPLNLVKFVDAYQRTDAKAGGYILIDKDDLQDNAITYFDLEKRLPYNWCIIETLSETQGGKHREFSETLHYKNANWVGSIGDDQWPVTYVWDQKTLEVFNENNNEKVMVVSQNDNWQPNRMVGAPIWRREYLDLIGGIIPAPFEHLYTDNIHEMVGRETGAWRRDLNIIVEHHHVFNNKAENDSTYQMQDKFWGPDREAFEKWLENDYLSTILKVKHFLNTVE